LVLDNSIIINMVSVCHWGNLAQMSGNAHPVGAHPRREISTDSTRGGAFHHGIRTAEHS